MLPLMPLNFRHQERGMSFTLFEVVNKNNQEKLIERGFTREKTYRSPVPREEWERWEIYFNMKNTVWRKLTDGAFPATDKSPDQTTHALYVKDAASYGIIIYPTTTARQYDIPNWYIPKGMIKKVPKEFQKKDVYVLKLLERPMPPGRVDGEDKLCFGGIFQENWMVAETR